MKLSSKAKINEKKPTKFSKRSCKLLLSSDKNECWLAPFFFLLNPHKPLLLQLSITCCPWLHQVWPKDPIIMEALDCNICGKNVASASTRQIQGTSHRELHPFSWFSYNSLQPRHWILRRKIILSESEWDALMEHQSSPDILPKIFTLLSGIFYW